MQDSERDTDVKNILLDYVGEGKGGKIWENNVETCILLYVKQMTSVSSMHEAGHPKPVLWDYWEGQGGWEVGGGFRMGGHIYTWLIHANVWQKPPQYCKNNKSPIKIN